jgi:cytochrome c-type biogenesis protein CcmF
MVPVLVAAAVGPMLGWKRGDLLGALQRLWAALAAALLAGLAALWITRGGPVMAVFGFALAAWTGVGAIVEWAERTKLFRAAPGETWRRAVNLPRAAWGMTLAHLGLALTVAGISASAFDAERIEILAPGQSIAIAGYTLRLDGVRQVPGPNYTAEDAAIAVLRDGAPVTTLHPERRFFTLQRQTTSQTAIRSTPFADLYLALGEADGHGGWTVRAYWKPLVVWIWGGALVMALGGVVSLTDRRWRVGAARRVRAGGAMQAAAGD